MPELPEVETIRGALERALVRKKITSVTIRLPKMIRGSVRVLKRHTVGQRITSIERRGKYLLWHLTGGHTLIVHLKMTGQLVYVKGRRTFVGGHPIQGGTDDLPNRYSHVYFTFSQGARVYFNDQRQFGFVECINTDAVPAYFTERKMGPEPLSPDFTLSYFRELLRRRPGNTIKQLLLDQTAVAGIGNIYAIESLYLARIRPSRRVHTITRAEQQRLYHAIRRELRHAVRAQRAAGKHTVDAAHTPDGYIPALHLYGRGGEPCERCGTTIRKITLGGRGTTYCPQCQR